jgi:hypothetical protein
VARFFTNDDAQLQFGKDRVSVLGNQNIVFRTRNR